MASCRTLMDNLLCTTSGDGADADADADADDVDVEDASCSGLTPSTAAVAEEDAAAGVAVLVCSKILSMLQSCEKILAIRLGMSLLSTDIFRRRDIVWKKYVLYCCRAYCWRVALL